MTDTCRIARDPEDREQVYRLRYGCYFRRGSIPYREDRMFSDRFDETPNHFTHEIVHFAFRVGDNNNNPYEPPFPRAGSGPWDIMDRGSFNGPGGPHRRWVVPAADGASMPAGLMLRSKMRFEFLRPGTVLTVKREDLPKQGIAIAKVTARAADPAPGYLAGIAVRLDGGDRTPPESYATNPNSAGDTKYDFYTVEVVQRIGYDSFTPDNGVLISKNLDNEQRGGGRGGFHPFTYVIDAHPEDIKMVDFVRPHGEKVMRTVGDYRQLNDALFHAGAKSGSQFEWIDLPNRLHFYIVDLEKDAAGILSYTIGVSSLDGAGLQQRGLTLTANSGAACTFKLTNTGAPSADPTYDADIYRLTVTAEGAGWTADVANNLATLKPGASANVPVSVTHTGRAAGRVTLKAQSESDPTKTATATCTAR